VLARDVAATAEKDKSTVRPRHRPCATNAGCVYEGVSLKLKRC
jgi:hypothetical protein